MARRRRTVAVLTALASLLPMLVLAVLWSFDRGSRPTTDMVQSQTLGSLPAAVTSTETAVTPAARAHASATLQSMLHTRLWPDWQAWELPVKWAGVTHTLRGEERPWADGSQQGVLHVINGTAPVADDECAVTPGLARELMGATEVMVGERPCRIVGVATSPKIGSDQVHLFLGPGTLASQPLVGRSAWLAATAPTETQVGQLQDAGFTVTTRSSLHEPESLLSRHVVLLGLAVGVALIAPVTVLRLVVTRTNFGGDIALRRLGAGSRFLALSRIAEACVATLVGLVAGLLLLPVTACLMIPRVAQRSGIEPPAPSLPWAASALLGIGMLIMAGLSALFTMHRAQQRARPGRLVAAAETASLVLLATRQRRVRRGSTRALVGG